MAISRTAAISVMRVFFLPTTIVWGKIRRGITSREYRRICRHYGYSGVNTLGKIQRANSIITIVEGKQMS